MLSPLGRKVYAIVNYDNFEIFPDIIDEYSAMVRDLVDRFYSGVTRYTTSGFLRTKLGDALKQRAVAPHIYESAEEASAHLRELEGKTAQAETANKMTHMNKITQASRQAGEAPADQASAKARHSAAIPHCRRTGMLSPDAVDALADIAKRTNRLVRLYAERLKSDDGYQVIDPRTVAAHVPGVLPQNAEADPAPLVKEQIALWSDLALLWQRTAARLLFNAPAEPVIAPAQQDKRFKNELWAENPFFDYLKQSYLLMSRFLKRRCAASRASIRTPTTRRILHPPVPQRTVADQFRRDQSGRCSRRRSRSRGENLINGLRNLIEDLERGGGRLSLKMATSTAFRFGENIASSPGKVVFQNELMQLIQYAPSTPTVHRRPLLIVPPWINKFYILDLKPKNSFIKWCVDQGHTVFVISWVNPGAELAGKEFSDYLLEGPLAALDAIEQATGEAEVNVSRILHRRHPDREHARLYERQRSDERIASATLFTTLLDFADVGDISVFIDEAQLQLADEHMERLGYLEGHHMAEAFNLLRENDLIWFFFVNNYLLGREPAAFDLLYWNSDSTRMPATMQVLYLRNMYHRNVLKDPGGITLANVPIDLRKIEVPVYFLSTREDHIAPWRSTYAGTQLVSGPVRFVLGASGHVAGVINPPSANKYGYWTNEALPADRRLAEQGRVSSGFLVDRLDEVDRPVTGAGRFRRASPAAASSRRSRMRPVRMSRCASPVWRFNGPSGGDIAAHRRGPL